MQRQCAVDHRIGKAAQHTLQQNIAGLATGNGAGMGKPMLADEIDQVARTQQRRAQENGGGDFHRLGGKCQHDAARRFFQLGEGIGRVTFAARGRALQ